MHICATYIARASWLLIYSSILSLKVLGGLSDHLHLQQCFKMGLNFSCLVKIRGRFYEEANEVNRFVTPQTYRHFLSAGTYASVRVRAFSCTDARLRSTFCSRLNPPYVTLFHISCPSISAPSLDVGRLHRLEMKECLRCDRRRGRKKKSVEIMKPCCNGHFCSS